MVNINHFEFLVFNILCVFLVDFFFSYLINKRFVLFCSALFCSCCPDMDCSDNFECSDLYLIHDSGLDLLLTSPAFGLNFSQETIMNCCVFFIVHISRV